MLRDLYDMLSLWSSWIPWQKISSHNPSMVFLEDSAVVDGGIRYMYMYRGQWRKELDVDMVTFIEIHAPLVTLFIEDS